MSDITHHPTNAFIGEVASVAGHPAVAVKDLIDVAGLPTTGGGPSEGAPVPDRDAHAIANARRAGALIIGKTNLYEWGYGVTSENRSHGDVRNPRDLDRSAGGSSGGSAAAVAAGLCDWAVGTDTAGSVRIPAALCGVVGYKPSYDLISRSGVLPLSPSQDTIGVLAPTVAVAEDGARALADPAAMGPVEALDVGASVRLAVPAGWLDGPDDLDVDVAQAWWAVAGDLPRIDIGAQQALFDHAQRLQSFEASQVHATALRDDPSRFHPDVRSRLVAAAGVTAAEAKQSAKELVRMGKLVERAFTVCDVLVLPTTACVAPLLRGPDQREALTRYTRPFNGTGQPAISLPLPTAGLPVGLQLVGRRNHDARLLAAARRVEAAIADGRPLASL